MKKKERVFWIIFYIFPVVVNIGIFIYFHHSTINVNDVYTKIGVVETNAKKELYSVKRYYSWDSKILDHTNTYTLESSHFSLRDLQNNDRYVFLKTYPKKDIFFQYRFNDEYVDKLVDKHNLLYRFNLKIKDVSDDISYDEEHQQLIVRHFVPKDCISVQKDEIHGVKVIYEYEEE